jgi:hypothetical protein
MYCGGWLKMPPPDVVENEAEVSYEILLTNSSTAVGHNQEETISTLC